MSICDLDFQQDFTPSTPITGGIKMDYLAFMKSYTQIFLGGARGSYQIVSKAIALGRSRARVTGFAEGRIMKTPTGVISMATSSSQAIAD